jgi:hypothetical protein
MRNRDCLFLGKLDPNGGVLEGPLAFAADDKETGILELSLWAKGRVSAEASPRPAGLVKRLHSIAELANKRRTSIATDC